MSSYDKDGYLIVNETYSCEHFEPVPGRSFCMKECWYCKWSGFFDMEKTADPGVSICRYKGNGNME